MLEISSFRSIIRSTQTHVVLHRRTSFEASLCVMALNNILPGKVPPEIGSMTRLVGLELGHNFIVGGCPGGGAANKSHRRAGRFVWVIVKTQLPFLFIANARTASKLNSYVVAALPSLFLSR